MNDLIEKTSSNVLHPTKAKSKSDVLIVKGFV
jgi:hypothetical protein